MEGDTTELALTDEALDALADRLADRLATRLASASRATQKTFALVDARGLAAELGVSVDYVYRHQAELGAMPLGDSPKARLKFDLDRARQALDARRRRSYRPRRR
ncbi:MAG: hypothetical protein ACRDPA_08605 [Solirubrobacteraceae bacterium]